MKIRPLKLATFAMISVLAFGLHDLQAAETVMPNRAKNRTVEQAVVKPVHAGQTKMGTSDDSVRLGNERMGASDDGVRNRTAETVSKTLQTTAH